MFREPGLPCELPAFIEQALNCEPHLCELEREVRILTAPEGAGLFLNEEKRRLIVGSSPSVLRAVGSGAPGLEDSNSREEATEQSL